MNRVGPKGTPIDMVSNRWYFTQLTKFLPTWILDARMEKNLNDRFDHYDYGIAPKGRWSSHQPTINDELPNRIACGSIIVKCNVKLLNENSVEFEDCSKAENIDVVIYATGFNFGFPFIKHPDLEVKDNKVTLFKYAFPPSIEPATLAIIGCFQPSVAINPVSEMQCRWATRVFKVVYKTFHICRDFVPCSHRGYHNCPPKKQC